MRVSAAASKASKIWCLKLQVAALFLDKFTDIDMCIDFDMNMDIDIFGLLESDMTDVLKSTVDKNEIIEELVWATRDILPILRIFPRHLKWFLKDFAKKNYQIEIKQTGYERELKKIAGSIKFLSFTLFSVALILSGVFLNNGKEISSYADISIISYLFWFLGMMTFFRGTFSVRK